MIRTAQFRVGPPTTPAPIKLLIIITCLTSVVCALINPIFHQTFDISGPTEWLSLSWYGLVHRTFLWQPVTALFLMTPAFGVITFFYLISLAFTMYVLWVIGTSVIERIGETSFWWLYFFCGILAEFLPIGVAGLIGSSAIIAGPAPAILGLAVVWTMIYPDLEILLFFVFPIKAKWLVTGILGAILLINLSQGDIVHLLLYLGGVTAGYLYGVLAWDLSSPFPFTHSFENGLARIRSRWFKSRSSSSKGKIIDFRTGKDIESDENFVDAMLTKISKEGEQSLTWWERRRLKRISNSKRKK